MKWFLEIVKRKWRLAVTTAFVFMILMVPGSKGILGKFITVNAGGGGGHNGGGGHHGGGGHNGAGQNNTSSASGSYSSYSGPPQPNPNYSPQSHGNGCSTGRRHTRSHHNHHKPQHSHYRPNGH